MQSTLIDSIMNLRTKKENDIQKEKSNFLKKNMIFFKMKMIDGFVNTLVNSNQQQRNSNIKHNQSLETSFLQSRKMSQISHALRTKLLLQAKSQLEELKVQKISILLGSKARNDANQKYVNKSKKVVDMYKQLLVLYPFPQVKFTQHDDSRFNRQNAKSHFSRHIISDSIRFGDRQVKDIIANLAITSTLAQVYTNCQNNFEEAATLLLKAREPAENAISEILNDQNSREENSFLQERSFYEQDQYQQQTHYYTKINQDSSQSIKANTYRQQSPSITPIKFSLIRSFLQLTINLVINLILQKKYAFAVETFNELIQFIESLNNKSTIRKCLDFIYYVWFNTENFYEFQKSLESMQNKLDKFISSSRQLSIQEALSLTHLMFNSNLFTNSYSSQQTTYPQKFICILQKAYDTFMQKQMYDHSFFILRYLLQSPIEPQSKQKYFLLLKEMFQTGKLQQNVELQNIESVECFKCIIQSLRDISKKYKHSEKNPTKQMEKSRIQLFQLIVKIQISKITSDNSLSENQRNFFIDNLKQMLLQPNYPVINQMLNLQFAKKLIKQISIKCQNIKRVCYKQVKNCLEIFCQNLNSISQNQKAHLLSEKCLNVHNTNIPHENRPRITARNVSPLHSRKYLKLISTSIFTESSSITPQTPQKHRIFDQSTNFPPNVQKKLSKMVRLCEYGAFLNKRNFNSDGGEFKFIKLTKDCIKWGKSAQKIEESSHSYALKDIKGILYGKITPNLKKLCNKSLKQDLCFSLVLQKRSMDFYCKDYNQVQTWVCGISVILKRQNQETAGYTAAKLRWRKMFAILREAFIQPLKAHERNQFYFQNAYSLIQFKKNGYKLPLNR